MGYDIYIGQAVIDDEVDEEWPSLDVRVKEMEHPNAPAFEHDVLSAHKNGRSPGYIAWSEFLNATELTDLFMNDERGLMREHPGTCRLFESHYQQVHAALERWRTRHPDAVPGFESMEWGGFIMQRDRSGAVTIDSGPSGTAPDAVLARLIWLDWWIRYALDHCTIPAIHNH